MSGTEAPNPRVLLGAAELVGAFTSPIDLMDVEVHGGLTVRVRAITKREQLGLAKLVEGGRTEDFQIQLFIAGVVTNDVPLTEDQVRQIIDTWPAGSFDKVLNAVSEVGGQTPGFRAADEDQDGGGR